MSAAPRLLIVWHSRTGYARAMAAAFEHGARAAAAGMGSPLTVLSKRAAEAQSTDLIAADGYLFAAPENLATVSGEMKEFFDRTYYDMFEASHEPRYAETSRLLNRPYGLAIAAGSDGSGAAKQVERICTGWRLKPVADTLIERNGQPQTAEAILADKECPEPARARCAELGGLVAATLLL